MTLSFDHLAEDYDATRGLPPDTAAGQIADCILRLTHATPNTRFLEPGVGTGRIALPLVQRGYPYTGVDISEQMLDEFSRKAQGIPDRLTLIRADATSLPFADASFDVVLTSGLLYYIPDWRQALAEIRRVLKPRGLYLYCYEETERNTVAEALDSQWQAILTGIGFPPVWGDNFSDEDALQELQTQGAVLEKVTAATWHYEYALDEYLDSYATRVRPLYQEVPDELFSAAVGDFRAWVGGYSGPEDVVSIEIRFIIQKISLLLRS